MIVPKRVFFLVFVSFLFISPNAFSQESPKVKVVFRYDDYHLKPTEINYKLLNIFQKHKIPLVLGIIPYKDDDLIFQYSIPQLLDFRKRIENKEIEIALHGYNHKDNGFNDFWYKKKYSSEFKSMNYKDQYNRIKNAKETLEKLLHTNIEVFIPPWDSYDDNTLRALENLNFKIISSDITGTSNSDILQFIPAVNENIFGLEALIKKNKNKDVVLSVLFHPYDFTNDSLEITDRTWILFNKLDSLLTFVNSQSYVEVNTFASLSKVSSFDKELFQAHVTKNIFLFRLLNLKFNNFRNVLRPLDTQKHFKLILQTGNIILHALLFAFVFLFMVYVRRFFRLGLSTLLVLSSIFTIGSAVFLLWISESPAFISLLIILGTSVLGLFSGVAYNYYKSLSAGRSKAEFGLDLSKSQAAGA